NVLPRSFAATALVLPDWLITSTQNEKGDQLVPEFRGEKEVLKTSMNDNRPVYFVRKISLPADAPQKLQLRVGHEQGKSWTVEVQLGDQKLLTQIVDDQSAAGGWLIREIDLKPWAGRTVWITVGQNPTAEKDPGSAFWKSATIIPQK
ncbi:MAG: hypothetical protein KDA84_23060, partial [Planctomycetaceae bacterium]|nr:hypothetical protein [Planctomycetaceae bacterium]